MCWVLFHTSQVDEIKIYIYKRLNWSIRDLEWFLSVISITCISRFLSIVICEQLRCSELQYTCWSSHCQLAKYCIPGPGVKSAGSDCDGSDCWCNFREEKGTHRKKITWSDTIESYAAYIDRSVLWCRVNWIKPVALLDTLPFKKLTVKRQPDSEPVGVSQ